MMIPGFYAQVEPILKAAGFQGKVEGENKLDLHKGNVSLTLYHMDEPSDNAYTRVCLWFKLKNKLMKEIPPFERLWVCNDLACKFPDLAFLIDNNDAIHVPRCKTMNCVAQALCRTRDSWWQQTHA